MEVDVQRVTVLVLLALFAVLLFSFDQILKVKKYIREPTYIPSKLPYCGHIIGLLKHKMYYYSTLTDRYRLRIFSLAMPEGKVYVVTDPGLVSNIQKASKSLSFWAMEAKFTVQLAGLSKPTARKFNTNVTGAIQGQESLFAEGMKITHEATRPGEHLKEINKTMATAILHELDQASTGHSFELDLWEWTRHVISLAAMQGIYGQQSPFRDRTVEANFWTFSANTISLLTGIFPSIFAHKGYQGREKVVQAFERYFETNGVSESSFLIRCRHEIMNRYGINFNDQARFECVNTVAILANTVPTAFWTLWNVLSRPELLTQVRAEAQKLVSTSAGANTRWVLEDTLLADGQYLLKKDAVVMIPSRVMHFDQSTWGPSVRDFDAERFSRPESAKLMHPAAFRGFGGGTTLCPGRFLASTEILTFTVLVALMFDIEPIKDRAWVEPPADESNMSLATAPPREPMFVRVKPRAEWMGGEWDVVA